MNIVSKRLFIIAGVFLVVLVIGSIFAFRFISDRIGGPEQKTGGPEFPGFGENEVRYSQTGFKPDTITVDMKQGISCVARVVNESQNALKIGVSPHKASGDPGPDYKEIPAGEAFLFDPRFSGYTELKFHNHATPEHEFTVKYAPSCR